MKGVGLLLEEEVFDSYMKDTKMAAQYFAIMLRSIVTRQVCTGALLPTCDILWLCATVVYLFHVSPGAAGVVSAQ